MKVKCVTWAVKLPINNARERPNPMSCSLEFSLSFSHLLISQYEANSQGIW